MPYAIQRRRREARVVADLVVGHVMPRRLYSCWSSSSGDHLVERLILDRRWTSSCGQRPAPGLLRLLHQLLRAALPVRVKDVSTVDVATAVVEVTGVLPMRPDVWKRRKPPMNATARIQKTNLAELRIVWSTGELLRAAEKRNGGSLKSYRAMRAKIK